MLSHGNTARKFEAVHTECVFAFKTIWCGAQEWVLKTGWCPSDVILWTWSNNDNNGPISIRKTICYGKHMQIHHITGHSRQPQWKPYPPWYNCKFIELSCQLSTINKSLQRLSCLRALLVHCCGTNSDEQSCLWKLNLTWHLKNVSLTWAVLQKMRVVTATHIRSRIYASI